MSTPLPHHAEPEQNELAHWFVNFQRKIEPYTNKILLAMILGTIGAVAYQVMAKSAAAKVSSAWSEYAICKNADDYKKVADDFSGSAVEAWSRLQAAREYISSGVQLSMTNRKASDESLDNGKAQLELLLNSKTTPEEVREQALSQMAVCLEALCDGNVGPATQAYEQLLKEFPVTHYAPWAKNRIAELKKPATGEFYAWFRKAQPAPPERPKPQDVKPGEAPNVKLTPDEGDPQPPGTPGTPPVSPATPEAKPAAEAPVAPATETPAAEAKPAETPAAPEAPAAEKPAETPAAPATPEAPAAEKPAEPTAPPAAPPAEPAATPPAAEAPAAEAPAKPAEPAAEAPKP